MNVLVIGSGGREHAFILKIKQSLRVHKIYCAPGNGGISKDAECVAIPAHDIEKLLEFALSHDIGLTVVGPEIPLVMGIVDEFEKHNLKCFGPRKRAAEIEGSKVFSKGLMRKYGIPTAGYEEFSDSNLAVEYLKHTSYPVVVKADGLAAGKGVIIARDFAEASDAVLSIMEDRIFKEAGDMIVIEEFIEGLEVSVLAFTDGKCIKPMESSMDHKRAYDNDEGPNTGGMGAISPNPYYPKDMADKCMEEIFRPTINALNNEGRTFKGVLFFGLMLTDDGPKVLEYNCRFGDPETQAVLPRLKTDLVDIMLSCLDENLEETDIEWLDEAACCVVISSGGYPGDYEKGKVITGLDTLPGDVTAYHSGTRYDGKDILTDGGRVLGITAMGTTISEASDRVYSNIDNIHFDGMYYRKDIGR